MNYYRTLWNKQVVVYFRYCIGVC